MFNISLTPRDIINMFGIVPEMFNISLTGLDNSNIPWTVERFATYLRLAEQTYPWLAGGFATYPLLFERFATYSILAGGFATYLWLAGGFATYLWLAAGFATYPWLAERFATYPWLAVRDLQHFPRTGGVHLHVWCFLPALQDSKEDLQKKFSACLPQPHN